MKIAMLTSWNVKCGIFTYTRDLSMALSKLGVDVYIVPVERFCYKPPEYWRYVVNRRIPKDVDLIHIQNEYGIFRDGYGVFYPLLKSLGKPIVTTMHATGLNLQVDEEVAVYSDIVIVHNEFCRDRFGYPCKIIPHGLYIHKPMDKKRAKKLLGYGVKDFVACIFGFINPYKGYEGVIRILPYVPGLRLMVAGGWHIDVYTPYMNRIKQLANKVAKNRVRFLGYVDDKDLPKIFGASDICIANYRFATESGALLTTLSYGKCVVAKNIPAFRDKPLIFYENEAELANRILELMDKPRKIKIYEDKTLLWCLDRTWNKVAIKHIKIYEKLL